QRRLALNVRVNCAAVQGECNGRAGFQQRETRWTTNADLTAFGKINARVAGSYAYVASVAQDRSRFAVDNLHANGTANDNIFAIDDANGIPGQLIGSVCMHHWIGGAIGDHAHE